MTDSRLEEIVNLLANYGGFNREYLRDKLLTFANDRRSKPKNKFNIGKYYKHSTGKMIFICGVCSTHAYGMCLMAEDDYGSFYPVGNHEGATDNWCEITEEEFLHGRE